MKEVSMVIVVDEEETLIDDFIAYYKKLLINPDIERIVIWKRGGELLKQYADVTEKSDVDLCTARKRGFALATSSYILNADVDTRLPHPFLPWASIKMKTVPDVGVVALDYDYPFTQGHLAFGASLFKTELLKHYYDRPEGGCECINMWNKVRNAGFKIIGLPMFAIHKKEVIN
jgi:hypothetical protein